jgi:hypothetical protein
MTIAPPAVEAVPTKAVERRSVHIGLRVLAACGPMVVSFALLHLWLGRSIVDYVPVQSDDLSYWHQASSFARVGFGNGYYTYEELPAALPSAYGAWGPMFPMVYGALLFLTGTVTPASVVLLNLVLFGALVFVALLMARPTVRQTVVVGLVLASYPPLLVYLPGGMQEPLHHAFAVLIAAAFLRLLNGHRHALATLCGIVVIASLFRPTWSFLLLPATFLAVRGKPRVVALKALAAACSAVAALSALFPLWAAPYPYGVSYRATHADGLQHKASVLFHNVKHNLHLLVQPGEWVLRIGAPQFFALVLVGLVALFLLWRKRSVPLTGVVFLALALPAVFVVLVYGVDNSTRTLSPHLLFAAVLVGLTVDVVPVAIGFLALNLAMGVLVKPDFLLYNRPNYTAAKATIDEVRPILAEHLKYRPDADPWCNTLLDSARVPFQYQLAAVPAGFGISVDIDHSLTGPVKSAYVLAKEPAADWLRSYGTRLERIADTPQGTLYRNAGSPCFDA